MKHLPITILTSLVLSILLLFAGCSDEKAKYPEGKKWGEILMEESVDFEMLPLQPPSNDPIETARGLMRCERLHLAYYTVNLEVCGLDDWETKNEGGIESFAKSKRFKECKYYVDHKPGREYAYKFRRKAHHLAEEEENLNPLVFMWHGNRELNAYHEVMQEIMELHTRALSIGELKQEMEKIVLSGDLTTCMDYRDYVDLEGGL